MDDTVHHTLPKAERLSGKTSVETLLRRGHWGNGAVLRYCWMDNTDDGRNRIMVSVPKRLFKRAVKRNLLKRRIREAYRNQKQLLSRGNGTDVLFMYNSKEVSDYQTIYSDVGDILSKISDE